MSNILQEKLNTTDLLSLFTSGCKKTSDFKIGIEYERLPLNNETFHSVDYSEPYGICEFLRTFARNDNWDYLMDETEIIGLKKLHDTITLEPGCQLELSLEPQKKISEIKSRIDEIDLEMQPILEDFGFNLLNYGISPVSTYKMINLLPKRRYNIMARYLWGILSDVMMRETAGIQACFDFASEYDAARKFRIANMLTPFVTAIYANSPIRGGVDTGYKTFRSLAWINTDNERCGFAGKFQHDFGFECYIETILNTPVIYIERDNKIIPLNGAIKFKDFMKHGYSGYIATLDDFKLHANMYFPEVRLRKFIEIRNHDCVGNGLQYSILALYKGILYSNTAMDKIEELLSQFSYNDIFELRYNVPKHAIKAKIKHYTANDIANEILEISKEGLTTQGNREEYYLEPILELTSQGLCPADLILKNWYGIWNKDISKFIEALKNQ